MTISKNSTSGTPTACHQKKKRTAHDGEHITFATISDHAAYGFSPTFATVPPIIRARTRRVIGSATWMTCTPRGAAFV